MNKPMISEALSKAINTNSKLVNEQVARISKPSLPTFATPKIGTMTLGNTDTH